MANDRNFEVKNGLLTTQTVTAGAFVGDGSQLTNLDYAKITSNLPDPILTLAGDASGTATFTDLGNATLTVAIDGGNADTFVNLVPADFTLDRVTDNGNTTTNAISVGNITAGGYLRGPASLTIDPSPYGDIGGTVVIRGNLQVDGVTTTVNSTNISVDDVNIELAAGAENAGAANGAGLTVDLGTDGATAITYDSSVNRWTFDRDVEADTFIGDLTGNATSADQWSTARTITLTGAVTGNTSIDGSGNVTLATTATSDPTLTLAGDASGTATFTDLGNATLTVAIDGGNADTFVNLVPTDFTLDFVTDNGASTSNNLAIGDLTAGEITVDNIISSGFLRGPSTFTIDPVAYLDNTGTVDIAGNLEVGGATTTINSTDVTIAAANIELASGNVSNATAADGAGITVDLGTDGTTSAIYDAGTDRWVFDRVVEADSFVGAIAGTAATADQWTTARTLTLTGSVTGSVSIDGSQDVTLNTSPTNDPTLTINGDAAGSATFTNLGDATLTLAVDGGNADTLDNLDSTDFTLDFVAANGNTTSSPITVGNITADDASFDNITTTGYLRGPANFVIDPAAFGDDTGTVVIAGNLQIDGTTTTINSTNVSVEDLQIELASGATNPAAADTAGLLVNLGSSTFASITYESANDLWASNKPIVATTFAGDLIGNADTASTLETARNVSLSGAVTGVASFDGSSNITIATTATSDPTLTLSGDASGTATFTNLGDATLSVSIDGGNADTFATLVPTDFDLARVTNSGNTTTNNISVGTVTATDFIGDGSQVSNINFANISSNLPDPTLTLDGDATGTATFTDLGDVTLNVTVDGGNAETLDGIDSTGFTLDRVTGNGSTTTNAISVGNITGSTIDVGQITTSGNLRGPATFIIDPSPFADIAGTVVIRGDLEVEGTTTTINSTTISVDDVNLTLANGATNAGAADGAGITVDLGTNGTTAFTYVASLDRWDLDRELQAGRFIGDVTGDVTGNADTASAWETARTVTLSGAVTGSASVDGASNVNIATTATSDPTLTLDGDVSGTATFTNLGDATLTVAVDGGNAETLDNLDSAQFLRSDTDTIFDSNSDTQRLYITAEGNTDESLSFSVSGNTAFIRREEIGSTANLQFDLTGSLGTGNIVFEHDGTDTQIVIDSNRVLTEADLLAISDADTLDGEEGTYYLDFNNFTSAPSPTLTLSGDAAGTATFTELGNTTLNVSIDGGNADTLDNLDSTQFLRSDQSDTLEGSLTLQATGPEVFLDNTTAGGESLKIKTTTTESFIKFTNTGSFGIQPVSDVATDVTAPVAFVMAGNGDISMSGDVSVAGIISGDGSGLSNLDFNDITANIPDPTLTLDGDVSGTATFTNLGNTTLSVSVDGGNADTVDNLSATDFTLDRVTFYGNNTVNPINVGTVTTSGALRGPATFIVDPVPYDNIGGTVIVRGNLQVEGTTTTIESTAVTIEDVNIELANGAANASEANGAGITANLGTDGNATITYDSLTDTWNMNKDLVASNFVGDLTGNADTATRWAVTRNISVSGAVTGTATIDGTGDVDITTTATSDPTLTLDGDVSGTATFTNLGDATLTVSVDGGNADTLDNLDSTQFVRSDVDDTLDGTYTVTGALTVDGDLSVYGNTINFISGTSARIEVTDVDTANTGSEFVFYGDDTEGNAKLKANEYEGDTVRTYKTSYTNTARTEGVDVEYNDNSKSLDYNFF